MRLSDCRVEVAMAVSDLDRARRFHEHQLGLAGEEEEAVRYPCADGTAIFNLSLAGQRRQVAGDARRLVRR